MRTQSDEASGIQSPRILQAKEYPDDALENPPSASTLILEGSDTGSVSVDSPISTSRKGLVATLMQKKFRLIDSRSGATSPLGGSSSNRERGESSLKSSIARSFQSLYTRRSSETSPVDVCILLLRFLNLHCSLQERRSCRISCGTSQR